ncbi:MAG: ammonium transporter [Candidatus Dormibacteraeota bacterium]|nr:ammonium transporter [Candidatus Dormibacteraeota bacterium]
MSLTVYLDLVPAPSWLDSGHTAWQLVAATLVGLMSVPGLAILYSGLMKRKWALNSALMVLYAFGATLIVWSFWAFKMSFGTPATDVLHIIGIPGTILSPGDLQGQAVIPLLKGAIPDLKFPLSSLVYFQFVFAAITVILLAGSILGRTSFKAWMLFVPLWITFVYSVNAFSIWGGGWIGAFPSWLSKIGGTGALDFSGGYVIHVAAGVSGLVAAAVIGPRLLADRETNRPSNLIAVITGAGLLWLGWNGFNAGDPYFAGADASGAILNTNLAAATAMIAWMALDIFVVGKATVGGMVNGMVAGLVGITPAAGFVDGYGAFAIGIAAGVIPFLTFNYLVKLPPFNRIDDTLGVMHTHLVAGAVGGLMVGLLADPNVIIYPGTGKTAAVAATGLFFGNPQQFVAQIIGLLFILVFDGVMTFVILKLISLVVPLRLTEKQLEVGDEAVHGDAAYELMPVPPSAPQPAAAASAPPTPTPTAV